MSDIVPNGQPNEDERELRRHQVLRLRHRRFTYNQIAKALHIDHATVLSDLNWIRSHWRETLGPNARFETTEFLGESLAHYEDVEATALADSVRANISVKDKMLCLATAMGARDRQIELLQDVGMLDRSLGTVTVSLPTAAQIRLAIAAAPFDLNDPKVAPTIIDVQPASNGGASGNGHGD